jgi:hypothetical protein
MDRGGLKMKVGDMVRLRKVPAWLSPHTDKRGKMGVVMEAEQHSAGNSYHVRWSNNTEGWVYERDVEVISES